MASTLDIKGIRNEISVVEKLIHFNNAGAALMPKCAVETVKNYLQQEQENGSYEAEEASLKKIENVYTLIAKMLSCHSEEIALFENSTLAWNTIFWSFPLRPHQVIITSESDYGSNYLALLKRKKRDNVKIIIIPEDSSGTLDIEFLYKSIKSYDVGLITISHIPTNNGAIQPVEEIGKIASKYGIPYLVDACQSVGQLDVDVTKIQCDFLTSAGRKFLRGPRGTAFAFIKQKWIEYLEPCYLDLTAAEFINTDEYCCVKSAKRFEFGENNIANRLGLGSAVNYALNIGIDIISTRVQKLANILRQKLSELPFILMHDSNILYLSGLVTFSIKGHNPQHLKQWLHKKSVNVSVSESKWTFINMHRRKLNHFTRASVHYYNTETEIERFCQLIQEYWKEHNSHARGQGEHI